MKNVVLNFVHFIKNIRHVGAVAPSSPYLAHDMTEPFRKALKNSPKPLKILELGPGTGPITKEIVALLRPEDKLDIVEIDNQFFNLIKDQYSASNIDVYEMNVMDFDPGYTYDFILSSIPYDQLPQELSTAIWQKQLEMLKPNSFFTYFKYYKFNFIRGQFERSVNRKHCVNKSFVLRNVPPAFVYTLKF